VRFRSAFSPLLPATFLSAVVAYELQASAADGRTAALVRDFTRPMERTGRVVSPTFDDWMMAAEVVTGIRQKDRGWRSKLLGSPQRHLDRPVCSAYRRLDDHAQPRGLSSDPPSRGILPAGPRTRGRWLMRRGGAPRETLARRQRDDQPGLDGRRRHAPRLVHVTDLAGHSSLRPTRLKGELLRGTGGVSSRGGEIRHGAGAAGPSPPSGAASLPGRPP
jgi:hypothetical protein